MMYEITGLGHRETSLIDAGYLV